MELPSWELHCAEYAAAQVKAATGRDIWAEIGGCPRSWRQAAKLYRRLGVSCLREAVEVVLGPAAPAFRANRGDLVMVDGALGVCRGFWVQCLDRMQPITRGQCSWPVGRGD